VQAAVLDAEAYRRTLAPLGIDVPATDVYALEGARSESIIEQFLRRHGQNPDRATLARLGNEKQAHFRTLGTPRLYPGASAMVHAICAAAPKRAIVTGTRLENLQRLMPDLLPLFDAVRSQEHYTHDKPHPEPYLAAAAALGVPPAACVCLENAVRGVQSARAAGYGRVIALATTMPTAALEAAGAHEVVADHTQAQAAVVACFD
jgi:beta-phosphoglucomutase